MNIKFTYLCREIPLFGILLNIGIRNPDFDLHTLSLRDSLLFLIYTHWHLKSTKKKKSFKYKVVYIWYKKYSWYKQRAESFQISTHLTVRTNIEINLSFKQTDDHLTVHGCKILCKITYLRKRTLGIWRMNYWGNYIHRNHWCLHKQRSLLLYTH